MPFTHEIDEAGGFVRIVGEGRVQVEDVIADVMKFVSAYRDRKYTRFLIDTTASICDACFDDTIKFSEFVERNPGLLESWRWAVVAPSDVNYGICRMLQTMTADLEFEIEVFREMGPAVRWLTE
ncbi:MAG: hypothetical protein ACYTHM_18110 [Planctomycetota bacterium]|jgi:hypothetical protein